MSGFSNTDTGNKPADPYTAKNIQDPELKEKVGDLLSFVDRSKFCMMTTKTQDGLLASRCMALAARVSLRKEGPKKQSAGVGRYQAEEAPLGTPDSLSPPSFGLLVFLLYD